MDVFSQDTSHRRTVKREKDPKSKSKDRVPQPAPGAVFFALTGCTELNEKKKKTIVKIPQDKLNEYFGPDWDAVPFEFGGYLDSIMKVTPHSTVFEYQSTQEFTVQLEAHLYNINSI